MTEVKNQPWYKERLHTKYIKSLDPGDTSKFLQGKNWTFIKDGLDDFRDGLPPPTAEDILIQSSKGLAPNLTGGGEHPIKQQLSKKRFNKDEVCFSRVTPLQQQRRDHIDEIEYGLTQHPLALYPHLEECLEPEVFEDVVDILDPEMNLASEDEEEDEDESYGEADEVSTVASIPHQDKDFYQEGPLDTLPENEEAKATRNPYRWLPRKEEKDKKDKKKAAERRSNSPSQDQHIKEVTNDFCDWVSALGGESNNIEESTITSLFASGYETKPALSVPIHVVELTNVPPELRMSATAPQQVQPTKNVIPETTDKKGDNKANWVKFKYGSWYLPPKTWKKRNAEEPLKDPKELKEQEMSEAKKKSDDLDEELSPMHGAKAFMEFIDRKGTRRPEFLDHVAEIQAVHAQEEQMKIEAEIAKQKKITSGRRTASS